MVIPWQQLSQDALQNLLESFVVQEGADQYDVEHTLNDKVDQVKRQLETGDACLVFDSITESCNIVPARNFQPLDANHQ